ncbi:hypothetical protein PN498_01375 [Oscillatoria sp. CS-180]|uniref:hypothetical protein n=1 Tax=Oscillatoria sp. CS-180 TaxID=3021720 RepID=UPI00232BC281|nr:hypothetical protein [Oscillatoria sp. CS-180]MDB9524625.1 hypothetical protein [Oscillatoria sp. CS-180]
MRSQLVLVGTFTFCLVAIVGTCRQQPVTSRTTTETEQHTIGSLNQPLTSAASAQSTTPFIESPNASETPFTPSESPNPRNSQESISDARATSPTADEDLEGQTATITAQNPNAEVNVRSLPSVASDPIGYGHVGDTVILGRSEVEEGGATWHYVTFQDAPTAGWIRSDLLEIQATPPSIVVDPTVNTKAQSEILHKALDERCGDVRAIEAYFVTQSHTIYVCKVRNQRHYLSQEQGTEQIITADDVEMLGGGYIIANGDFEYRLDSSSLTVVRVNDSGRQEEILQEAVVYSERY